MYSGLRLFSDNRYDVWTYNECGMVYIAGIDNLFGRPATNIFFGNVKCNN